MSIDPVLFDFSVLTKQTIKLLEISAARKNIELTSDVPARTLVYADEQTIGSVLQNLVSNAIKFTHKEGKVIISSKRKNGMTEIMVKDTGIGMSEQDLSKLFKIDVHHTTSGTANEEGSGLGLILCKELVEKNQGEIWVESEAGSGTKFHFTLPTQG